MILGISVRAIRQENGKKKNTCANRETRSQICLGINDLLVCIGKSEDSAKIL